MPLGSAIGLAGSARSGACCAAERSFPTSAFSMGDTYGKTSCGALWISRPSSDALSACNQTRVTSVSDTHIVPQD